MRIVKHLGLEAYRLGLLKGIDDCVLSLGYSSLAGVDEAGRGCLAGPVVAAAVIMRPDHMIPGVDDSKRISAIGRAHLARIIRRTSVAHAVGVVPASTIDSENILQATRLAMVRALDGLSSVPDCALVDAVQLPQQNFSCLHLVRADAVSYSVACASILAKVERDKMMVEYHELYPQYGFLRNKGYGAAEHREALQRFGPTPIHRLSFRSVIPRCSTEATH